MQLIQQTEASKAGLKFVISCEYFNKSDEPTHTTDFNVYLGDKKPNSFDIDCLKLVSAAQLIDERLFAPTIIDFYKKSYNTK